MANKMIYAKQVDDTTELCISIGWEDLTKYSVYYRSIASKETTKYVGLYTSKEAWDFYNAAETHND